MITQMEVLNSRVITSPLPVVSLGSEATDPIQIKNIDGLGPVNATVNTAQYGSIDGEFYYGSVVGKRNIVLTVGLNPDYATQSMEFLRQCLYQYFMPKSAVTLRFTSTHMPEVSIDGIVESFEPNMFSKDPEIQVSIICPQSEFTAVLPTAYQGVTVAFGSNTFTNVNYEGNVPAGFVVTVVANAAHTAVTGEFRMLVKNPDTGLWVISTATVDTTAGHNLEISTVRGDKHVSSVLISSGAKTSILEKVSPGSLWFPFVYGLNQFQVLAATPGQDWNLLYSARYGGI